MSWHLAARAAMELKRRVQARRIQGDGASTMLGVIVAVAVIATPAALIGFVMLLGLAAVIAGGPAAAGGGALGIPPVVFSAYLTAETNAPDVAADCEVDWPVIAGIWKIESDHATYRSRTVTPDGTVTPPLYGATLDGSTPGTAVITDSDQGLLDADPAWDRAVGPAQFLPETWRLYGQDGNRDGRTDPQNVYDAALGTVAYLCLAAPGDYTNPDDLAAALRRYNNSTTYVANVAGWIGYYRTFQLTGGVVVADGLYAFPLPVDAVTLGQIRRSHHDYPASDLLIPQGTPVYAAHPGTVTRITRPCSDTQRCRCGWGVHITGRDRHRYSYCHGTRIAPHLQPGTKVAAGELIMTSGNTGNSSAPHLHFQIRNPNGQLVCPQPLLEAWHQGNGVNLITAPRAGCTH